MGCTGRKKEIERRSNSNQLRRRHTNNTSEKGANVTARLVQGWFCLKSTCFFLLIISQMCAHAELAIDELARGNHMICLIEKLPKLFSHSLLRLASSRASWLQSVREVWSYGREEKCLFCDGAVEGGCLCSFPFRETSLRRGLPMACDEDLQVIR